MEPPLESGGSADHISAETLKSTAKWLVATGSAVGSLLVAGTQLKGLARIDSVSALWALLAAFAGVSAAAWLILAAARVLQARRPTLADLRVRERSTGEKATLPLEDPEDDLLKHVVARRNELLGPGRDSIARLERERNLVYNALYRRQSVTLGGRAYDPEIEDDALTLQLLEADIERRTQALQDAAELFETRRRFDQLITTFWIASTIIVLGAFAFVYIAATAKTGTPLREPVSVSFQAPTGSERLRNLGLDAECRGRTLSGVAVGGTYESPVVVTQKSGECPAVKLEDTVGLLVVPDMPD